jgi:dihydroorotate dehydrogenase
MSTSELGHSLDLRHPWMNAAGSLGFAPDLRIAPALESFGAFVTNPISVRPRRASGQPRQLTFPGGVLVHTSHPNPGLSACIKRYAGAWARAPLPIIVHLLSSTPEEMRKAALRIEELENILAIELGVEPDATPELVRDLLAAVSGELPVIAQLPPVRIDELADVALGAGVAAISFAPPRGTLQAKDGKLVSGRLYGAALYPQTLELARPLGKQKPQFIASGGIESKAQGEVLLKAGALAVQVDISLWK